MEQLERVLEEEQPLDVDWMTEVMVQPHKTVAPEELVLDNEPLGTPKPLGPMIGKPLFTIYRHFAGTAESLGSVLPSIR